MTKGEFTYTKSVNPTLPEWPLEPGYFRFSEALNTTRESDMKILRAWHGWFKQRGIETQVVQSRRHYNSVSLYRVGVESEISMTIGRGKVSRVH